LFFKSFCPKWKVFSKNPLKNVKKYNIMIAIIGLIVIPQGKSDRENAFLFRVYTPFTDKNLTTQGDFIV
jgi:hypothetical protein